MFVTFEGPEGGGKSTALKAVAESLREEGLAVSTTREPGAGPVGARIREILLHGGDLSPEAELLLFLADRANHVANVIRPALERGEMVLCDRFTDSTLVYQGIARGLDRSFVAAGNRFATGGLQPDLTLLFDLPAEIGLIRLTSPDRLDRQPIAFHRAVRDGFLSLAKENSASWVVLDATKSPAEVASEALETIRHGLRNRQLQ